MLQRKGGSNLDDMIQLEEGTHLDVCDVRTGILKMAVVQDRAGNVYHVKETELIRFVAIPPTGICTLIEFIKTYNIPKIAHFNSFSLDGLALQTQEVRTFLTDALSGPVRITEVCELDEIVAWVCGKTDSTKTRFTCLLIPEDVAAELKVQKVHDKGIVKEQHQEFSGCNFGSSFSGRLFMRNQNESRLTYMHTTRKRGTNRYSSFLLHTKKDEDTLLKQPDGPAYVEIIGDDIDDYVDFLSDESPVKTYSDTYVNFPSRTQRARGLSTNSSTSNQVLSESELRERERGTLGDSDVRVDADETGASNWCLADVAW